MRLNHYDASTWLYLTATATNSQSDEVAHDDGPDRRARLHHY